MDNDTSYVMPDDSGAGISSAASENTSVNASENASENTYDLLLSDAVIIDTLLNNSQDTIYFKDLDSRFILNSSAHVTQFGVNDPVELIGKSDADFYPQVFAEQSRQDELRIMKTGIPIINKLEQGMNAAGEVVSFSTSKYPLYDCNGILIGTWGTSRDVTKLVMAEEELAKINVKLRTLSLVDELSGLYNQRHFYDSLEMTIKLFTRKRRGGLSADFCLVIMDIDCFKMINDTYGHVVGDAAIRYVAGLLLAHTRSTDTAFRYGGDEYAWILQDTDLQAGFELSERLRKVVEQNPLVIDRRRIDLTISLGVVCFDNETSASSLVQKSDTRLYKSKHEGRNRTS